MKVFFLKMNSKRKGNVPNHFFFFNSYLDSVLRGETGYDILACKMPILSLMITDLLSLRNKMCSMFQFKVDAFAESQKQSWLGSLAMDGNQVWAHSSNTSLHGFGSDCAKSFLFLLVLITEHCPKMQRNKLICFYATNNL